jgi:hypothetical protein
MEGDRRQADEIYRAGTTIRVSTFSFHITDAGLFAQCSSHLLENPHLNLTSPPRKILCDRVVTVGPVMNMGGTVLFRSPILVLIVKTHGTLTEVALRDMLGAEIGMLILITMDSTYLYAK